MGALAYLGLGANLGDPALGLARAIDALEAGGDRVLRRARLYRTAPLGPPGQPDYLNTAVELETERDPFELLARCKAIEVALGRTPGARWGPRIIDLDILLYGECRIETPELCVPHRELGGRLFALAPLAELVPALRPPGWDETVAQRAARLADPSVASLVA